MHTPSIRPMNDVQLETLRLRGLRLLSTLLDGSLLVHDPVGDLYELGADGTLLPHVENRPVRLSPADLSGGD